MNKYLFRAAAVVATVTCSVGAPVTWTYVITNSGNITLSAVTLSDDKLPALNPLTSTVTLQPGEVITVTATVASEGYVGKELTARIVSQSGQTLQALGRCLDVSGGATANGTKVWLWTCNGTGAQRDST